VAKSHPATRFSFFFHSLMAFFSSFVGSPVVLGTGIVISLLTYSSFSQPISSNDVCLAHTL
jgi:hypothetical protein